MKPGIALLALASCVSTVYPPADPTDPVAVYLVSESAHGGLVLPRGGGRFVEYGYGDWDWYAMNADHWYDTFDTVLWPTQGTLGRREHASESELRRRFPPGALARFDVSRSRCVTLLARLDDQFAARRATEHWNPQRGMSFVKSSPSFWCLTNCNDVTADWLRSLGCEVGWVPIRWGLGLAEPARH